MQQRGAFVVAVALGVLVSSIGAQAQPATYHLHKEASKTSGLLQLKSAAPDARATTIASVDFRNRAAGDYLVKAFDTAAGVPNAEGTIPAGSVVSFTVWMKKSATAGVMYPRAKLSVNSSSGAALCAATGNSALGKTIAAYTLSCITDSAIAMSATDRFYLWIGVSLTVAPGSTSVKAQLSIEGALNGNYDSRLAAPLPILTPTITGLTPSSGVVGATVSIAGMNFGASQGSSALTFNGVAAAPASWTATTITAPVPANATTGPVVVSIGGLASNGVPFTVITDGSVRGVVSRLSDRTPVAGALVELLRDAVVVAQGTTDANGLYAIGPILAGVYAIRASASGLVPLSRNDVAIAAGDVRTEDFALDALNRGSVSYAYDELDRLIAVVDPSGASASYRYDAAGNILSIERQSAGTLSVFGFSPARGPAGTHVAIAGSRFSPTPGGNTVRFNGTDATVVLASDTQIVAVVPAGATSGAISVAAGGSIASSSNLFTVTTDAVPAITGFSPPVAAGGDALVVTGTNFDEHAGNTRVSENGSFVSPTSVRSDAIDATIPNDATSGHLSVRTPAGVAVSDGILFVPPPFYPASVVGFTASTAIGQSIEVPMLTDMFGLVAFDGVAGQRVAIRDSTFSEKGLLGPHVREMGWFWSFLGGVTLPFDGTYTLVHYPCYYECDGSGRAEVFSVPPDVTAIVAADDGPFAFDLTAGQRARLTFTARRGQHLTITMREGTEYLYASLVDANGFELFEETEYFDPFTPIEVVIREAGTYTLVLDPERDFDGDRFSIVLHEVVDTVVSLEIDGAAVTATIVEPEQDVYASFDGVAGAAVALAISDVTLSAWSQVTIRNSDGSILLEQSVGIGSVPPGGWMEIDLPATGTYTVFIDVEPYRVGSLTLQVVTRPADLTAAIDVGVQPDPPTGTP